MKKISVIGLGYVGSVLALVCASAKNDKNQLLYKVNGVEKDTNSGRIIVNSFSQGKFPFKSEDKKIDISLKKILKQQNFNFTNNLKSIKNSKVVIITINIDVSKKDFKKQEKNFLDLFNDVCSIINDSTIIIESTVPPGFCSKLLFPILMKHRKKGKKIWLCHSYERVMPGENYLDSIKNNYRVYSSDEKEGSIHGRNFLKTIINYKKFPLTKLNNTISSETSKIMENSYRALNIAFIDDWTKFAYKTKINLFKIIEAIKKRRTHSNIMSPGLGVGGYCLTKDPMFMSYSIKKIFKFSHPNFHLNKLSSKINENMPKLVCEIIKKNFKILKRKNFLLAGVAYKNEISDTRNTASKVIFDFLKRNKSILDCYDPYVSFWEEKKITIIKKNEIKKKQYDGIIFLTNHDFFKKKIIKLINLKKVQFIIDTNNCLSESSINFVKKNNIKFEKIGDWSN
jgi:UDP-N-acetyl-D-glucosamine dehydrogenase